MKKIIAIILCTLCITGTPSSAQPYVCSWAKKAGGNFYDLNYNMTVDAFGNTLLTGAFHSDTAVFDMTHLVNTFDAYADVYLAKYDPNGNLLWATNTGGNNYDIGSAVTTDALGNTYLTGIFRSTSITFGNITLTNSSTGPNNIYGDIFIVKYDASGNVIWAKKAGGNQDDTPLAISIDSLNNIYIGGQYNSTSIMFDSFNLYNGTSGNANAFVTKYDSAGNTLWATQITGSNHEGVYSLKTCPNGDFYVTGYFEAASIAMGSYTLNNTNAPYADAFVAKYNFNGNVLWATSFGGQFLETGNTIATDKFGNCYVGGYFGSNNITINGTVYYNHSNSAFDIFMVKYNSSGVFQWSRCEGAKDDQMLKGIAVDDNQNILTAGYFDGDTLIVGATTLVGNGAHQIFMAGYDSSGNNMWAKKYGGTWSDEPTQLALDASGNLYLSGMFRSNTITFDGISLSNYDTSSFGSPDIFITKFNNTTGYKAVIPTNPKINVYPNPCHDRLTINLSVAAANNKVDIINIIGQQVYSYTLLPGITTQQVNISSLTNGLYVCKVGNEIIRFVKE